jgi:hypothetical protein
MSTSTVSEKQPRKLSVYNHFVRTKMVELKSEMLLSNTKLKQGENFKLIGKAWQHYKKEHVSSDSTLSSASTVSEKKPRELTEYNHFVRAKMIELKQDMLLSDKKLKKGENFKIIAKEWREYKKTRDSSSNANGMHQIIDAFQTQKDTL